MSTAVTANSMDPPPKVNFSGLVGAKRRRMRSGGNVSALSNNNNDNGGGGGGQLGLQQEPPEFDVDTMMDPDEKVAQTSKCKGATTIPIFLKSTFISLLIACYVLCLCCFDRVLDVTRSYTFFCRC